MAKVRADQIKHALSVRHADDFFLTEVKDGPTQSVRKHFKIDALAFKKSWANPAIIGYEVKVDRSDFTRDDKWPAYLPLCNQFSFVCPTGMIQLDELPPEVGLVYYNPEKGTLLTKRKATYRLIEEPINMYKYIIMSKLDSERHPFFGLDNRKDYIEAYLEDKAQRKDLGWRFGTKLAQDLHKATEENQQLQREIERMKNRNEHVEPLVAMLKECGIDVRYGWKWEDQLRERLASGVSPDMKSEVSKMKQAVERLASIVG